jgi:hypothetical protein
LGRPEFNVAVKNELQLLTMIAKILCNMNSSNSTANVTCVRQSAEAMLPAAGSSPGSQS